MERVAHSPAAGEGVGTCPGCGLAMEEARCGHCGVALRAGGYRIIRVLSQGPHARLYLAEDEEGRRVALKELLFALLPSAEQLDAFEREATLLRELRHPRIPRFVKGFTEGSGVHTRMYLAQEYVSGRSLASELEQRRFTEEEVRGIAEEVLEILDYLHRLSPKVLHRDIKPANLVRGVDGGWVLVDFGAARSIAGQQTHRATLVGTFGYMPPEQLGGTVDERSDLYALGATLIHLLAGKPPETMLGKGLELDFRRHVDISAHLEHFLARLVAPRSEARLASAREALAYLRGQSTRPVLRRNLLGFALSMGMALLLAGLVLGLRASSAERRQEPEPLQAQPTREEGPAPTAPRLPERALRQPEPLPKSTRVPFDWIMAHWELGRPGVWVQDTSGHDHHGLVPTEGVRGAYSALEFLGTTGVVEVPDHRDFALRAPFSLTANVRFGSFENERGVIFWRGESSGREALSLETRPGAVLRLSLTQENGEVHFIEGLLPPQWKNQSMLIYATLDEHGELLLYAGCELVARGSLTGAPLLELDPSRAPAVNLGGVKGQRHGFHGELWSVQLMRGVMEKQEGPSCSFSLKRMGE